MEAEVADFVSRRWAVPGAALRISVERLHGGLESVVALARVAGGAGHPAVPDRLIVKVLPRGAEREARVYELLWRHLEQPPAVRVLGHQSVGDRTYLYLEDAGPFSSWPWADVAFAAAVCRTLARLHDSTVLPAEGFSWDYEEELARSAESTLQLASAAQNRAGSRYWRRFGDLRRVVAALPAIRSRLLAGETAVIHGDVHPGNACVRSGHPDSRVVLLDWGRARVGSPLEDVASWLHSLGCWEPQARRRHDTLMRAYLDSRRVRRAFDSSVRIDYALASASNGLSGAIRYHLAVAADPASVEAARYHSRRALAAWERVVRRTAALLSTTRGRCM